MSDITRISANEQAQMDQARETQHKRQPAKANAAATQQAAGQGQGKTQGAEKKLKSTFDTVLENMQDSPSGAMVASEGKFDSKLQELRHQDERGSSKEDNKEEDNKKTKDRGETKQAVKLSAAGVRGRVEGKEGSKGGQSQSGMGQDQQRGKSGDAQLTKESSAKTYRMEQFKEIQTAPAPSPLFAGTPVTQVQVPEAPAQARELPKAVLDQIINKVSILQDRDFNKEIQIDFHDNFFNGLTLKVTSRDGAVAVEFIAPNRDVQATFKNEREKLAEALGEKGIAVRSIEVSLR
jgi:hypothetical protein